MSDCYRISVAVVDDHPILRQRAINDVAQVEEPGERGGAAGTRGGMALDPPTVIR